MGLIRRREKGETYYYWYDRESGKRTYLGKLVDKTTVDKVRYIGANLSKLTEEERKEFLQWIGELKTALGLVESLNDSKLEDIDKKLEKVLKLLDKGERKLPDLLKVYEEVRNSMGIASLKDIRERMGLSREEFYSTFSNFIESNFTLYRGGEEGIVKDGTIFGIVKRG